MAGKSKFSMEAILSIRDQLTGPLKSMQSQITGLSRSFGRSLEAVAGSKRLNQMINGGIVAAGAALTGFVVTGIKGSIDLSEAMAKVGTIADTNSISLRELRKEMIAVSNRTGKAVTELTEATYQAISAGVETAKVAGFVETATKAAVGGFTDSATAVDALTSVLNAYGLQAQEATRISDQMLITQNFGKTTFGELAQSIGQVLPTAAALGVQTEELFGSIAALTKQGIQSSQAVTGMKAAFSNILKPTAQAQEMASQLGIEFNAAALESKGLVGFLDEIKAAAKGDIPTLAKLFGSTEALNAIIALTGKGSKDLRDALIALNSSAGATEAAFNEIAGAPGYKLNKALNRLKNSAIVLGDKLVPVVDAFSDWIDKIATGINEQDFEWIRGIVTTGLKFVEVATKLWPLLLGLAASFKVLSIVTGVFGVALGATPIGWIIAGVTGLTVAIVALAENWDVVTTKVKEAWEWFNALADSIGNAMDVLSIFKRTEEQKSGHNVNDKNLQTDAWGVPIYNTYANPETRASESRSYKETVSRNEVFVRPDRGAVISRTPGGPPEPALPIGPQ